MTDTKGLIGQTLIGRYTIESYLNAGGMQEVYIANDATFSRKVAIKTPIDERTQKRFKRSAVVSAQVTHNNVAKTLDFIEQSGRQFLVEELVDGPNLSDYQDQFSCLDPHLASFIFQMITGGLAAAHHRGIIHRDLKPSNIIVSRGHGFSDVKITDFGVAKMAEEELIEGIEGGEETMTGSKTVIGALPYMSPEMITDTRSATQKTDVWSCGALLYYMITGEYPFGSGLSAVNKIITSTNPPELPQKDYHDSINFRSLIKSLKSIIDSCLEKKPENRPTADQLYSLSSELCYSKSKREVGFIKNYASGTGAWGFIAQEYGNDVFFHRASFYGEKPQPQQRVMYSCYEGTPSYRAFPVLPFK